MAAIYTQRRLQTIGTPLCSLSFSEKTKRLTLYAAYLHCKIKETLLIRDLKPALNENVGSEKLLLY